MPQSGETSARPSRSAITASRSRWYTEPTAPVTIPSISRAARPASSSASSASFTPPLWISTYSIPAASAITRTASRLAEWNM